MADGWTIPSRLTFGPADSKIDLLDTPEAVTKKLRKAEAVPKVTENNGVLAFTEYVLLPAGVLRYGKPEFHVERRDAEPLVYTNIADMQRDYAADVLTPQILKPAVTKALIELMAPIQAEFAASKEWQEVTLKAYPPVEVKKKVKKVKEKGTRYPGGGGGAAAEDGNEPAPGKEATIPIVGDESK